MQKKGTVLLSTSLALPAVAGCSRAENFSQLSSNKFSHLCSTPSELWCVHCHLLSYREASKNQFYRAASDPMAFCSLQLEWSGPSFWWGRWLIHPGLWEHCKRWATARASREWFEYSNMLTMKGIFLIRILALCHSLVIPWSYRLGFRDWNHGFLSKIRKNFQTFH